MLTVAQLLEPLARHRSDEVVVTTMSVVRPWGRLSDSDLDFASADSAMGHAADLALGIALARPELKVVVFDGDGSVLMNLGGLTTLARYRPTNLVHLIFDNESLLSVGGFPTATSTGSDLAAVAAASGVPRAYQVTTRDELGRAFDDAMSANELSIIVAKVDDQGPSAFVTDLGLLENRFQFARYLQGR